MNSTERKTFRSSSVWKKFRIKIKRKHYSTDPITCLPLISNWNLHHINMNHNTYDNITDESMFIPLNKDTHNCVHYLYDIYKTDKDVVVRLTDLLEKMYKVNKGK